LESKLRKKKLSNRLIKLSINKIFISDGEFKYTNDKVNITIYVFNRQKYNYLLKIKKKYIRLFKKKNFLKKLFLIKLLGLNILKQQEEKFKLLENILPNYFKNNSVLRLSQRTIYLQDQLFDKGKSIN
jgi:hypothetical protein